MIFILTIGFFFGASIILMYPFMLIIASKGKKNAILIRSRADEIINNGKAESSEINEIIDKLMVIKQRRVVPFTEADQVRIEKLRAIRF